MRKKKLSKRAIAAILFLFAFALTLGGIWYMSGKTGYQSNVSSKALARYIEKVISAHFPVNKNDDFWIVTLNLLIRKAAHYFEYMFVGAFLSAFVVIVSKRLWVSILVTVTIGPGLASLDELRQSTVAGRTPRVFDIKVDSIGVLTGLVIVCLAYLVASYIWKLKKRIQKLEN